jgi:hypothetical protein
MADPVTLQDIYDLFKASQADLQASREEFDRRMAAAKLTAAWKIAVSGRLVANASREVGRLGDRWGTFRREFGRTGGAAVVSRAGH